MDEQDKINKDTVTKFKAIDKVLENIDSKVTEVRSSNHQVINMMKMLETQVGQLAGRLSAKNGSFRSTSRCRTSTTGKGDLNLMQAHPFRIRFRFIYN
jgi:nicotinamidase-related amidase